MMQAGGYICGKKHTVAVCGRRRKMIDISFKALWELDVIELLKLAVLDDCVMFLRLWPAWLSIVIALVVFYFVAKARRRGDDD
jgi:hypothetical protein